MSKEPKRVAFTTISQTPSMPEVVTADNTTVPSTSAASSRFGGDFLTPDVPPVTGKSGSGSFNGKGTNKTFRLQLELFESDSCKYPEFNYSKLMYLEKKKVKKLKQATGSNGFIDPFAENDDDVARIAKELEKKYASAYSTGRGRSKKKDGFCDIGMGYDESDSFIDNTDAYDEIIPEEVETLEGGFYINCGALEFANLNKKSNTTRTDEIIKMPDRPKKRTLSTSSEESSSSEDENEENDMEEDSESASEEEDNDKNTSNRQEEDKMSKKKYKHAEKRQKSEDTSSKKLNITKNGSKKQSKKSAFLTSGSSSNSPRPNTMEASSDTDDRNRQKVVKTTTVKDMLKAKRDNFLKSQEACGEGISKNVNGEVKCTSSDGDSSSESGGTDSGAEPGTQTDKKPKKPTTNLENSEKLRTTDTKLPALDSEVIMNITAFKELTKSRNLTGKKFVFDQKLTELLLKIDEALLCIDKNERNMVFAHMEYQLQLPKYFFLRKAKQVRIKEEKNKTNRALGKLRKAVIELMPKCITTYETELCKYADMQANIVNAEHPPKMPRKKFPWNNEIRNLLYEVYQVRWTSYAVLGTRKDSLEDFINGYMKAKVVEIWPNGWMRYEELQKEIEKRKNAAKKAKEKTKKDPKSIALVTGGSSINSTMQGAESILNTSNTYLRQFEDFPTNSNRSLANSDTESVASVSSNSLKGRSDTNASNKSMKNKVHKQSVQPVDNIYPVASTSAAAAAAAALGIPLITQSGAMDLVSPTRKTDHSITNIIAAMAAVPSTSATVTTATAASPIQTNMHSNIPGRPIPHIINLDDYKSPSDILQTSKQLASVTLQPTAQKFTNSTSKATVNSATTRRESGSESDGVEIVGVFPAKATTVGTSFMTAKPKSHKKSSGAAASSNFSNPMSGTPNAAPLPMEHLLSLANNNNSGNMRMALKDFERLNKQICQQYAISPTNIKGSPPNQ